MSTMSRCPKRQPAALTVLALALSGACSTGTGGPPEAGGSLSHGVSGAASDADPGTRPGAEADQAQQPGADTDSGADPGSLPDPGSAGGSQPEGGGSSEADVVILGDLDIIVPPGADGSLPPDLWIGCWNGPLFQVADLDVIVPLAEGDPGGVAEAIETFLRGGEGQFWPQEGWLILRQTEDEIMLVQHDADGVSFMDVSLEDGQWEWSGARSGGPCPLHYVVPDELNAVDWRLDPDAAPGPEATTLTVLIQERECVSGQGLGDRLRGPQIVITPVRVRIAFAAAPPAGGGFFTCPSNPEIAVTVELPEPIGDREIIEGLAIGMDLEDFLP